MKFGVNKKVLLYTAGCVWIFAGINILRIGIITWLNDTHYWLFKIGEATIVFPAGSHSNIIKWTGDFRKFKRANCDTDTAPGHSSLRNCTFVTKHTCAFVLFRCRSPPGARGLKYP